MSETTINISGNERALAIIGAFLIFITAFLLYYPALGLPPHGEDLARFVEDGSLQRISTYPDALQYWPHAPLTVFGYALNWTLVPLGFSGLHLLNIILHGLCGVLLYLFSRKLLSGEFPEPVAMLSGLALVVHPLATENVVYLYARPAMQATFFALLATLLFLHAINGRLRPLALVAALLCYVLAFASSFAVLGLPLIWLALTRVRPEPLDIAPRRMANLAAMAMMLALIVAHQASGISSSMRLPEGLSQIIAAQSELTFGLRHMLGTHDALADFTADYALNMLGLALFLLLFIAGLLSFFRLPFALPAWWAFIGLASLPCLVDGQVALRESSLYFVFAGLLLFLPLAVHKIPQPSLRMAGAVVLCALLAYGAYKSYGRTQAWADPVTFWGEIALDAPDNITPRLYQGRYLLWMAKLQDGTEEARHVYAQAKTALEAAERINAEHAESQAMLGESLFRLEEYDLAIEKFSNALRLDPFYPEISLPLALAYEKKVAGPGDVETLRHVVENFQRADRQAALSPPVRARLGLALLTLGNLNAAQRELRIAQNADPNQPYEATLSGLEKRLSDAQQSNAAALKALQEKPDQAEGIVLRARADMLAGAPQRAFYMLDRAAVKFADDRDVAILLGVASAGLGNTKIFTAGLGQKYAGDLQFWANLAVESAALSNWQGALAYLEHAEQWAEENAIPARVQLAGIALGLRQLPVAQRLAEEATVAHPDAPEPWLIRAQLAIATQDADAARTYITEAEKRGANPEALKQLQEQGGVDMSIPAPAPVRTIIR